jgi:hypothetical protein
LLNLVISNEVRNLIRFLSLTRSIEMTMLFLLSLNVVIINSAANPTMFIISIQLFFSTQSHLPLNKIFLDFLSR